ncbi:MAG: 2-C-methyl-D-erythritol 4-phosphate cytidylyltransferase [Porphyromonas sp.]|nr:2-C-methyl-D-erythritol 4-phosphate cytidylyltransferase [Porphyromonas sp.]
MKNRIAIIVAGGSGQRMQNSLPKQFIEINGLPVIFHTIRAFHTYDSAIDIVVVIPQAYRDTFLSLKDKYHFDTPVTLVDGGATRTESVMSGLEAVKEKENSVVAIHDGVRPNISSNLLEKLFTTVEQKDNSSVIPVVESTNSLRQITSESGESLPIDRSTIVEVQTPQLFRLGQIKRAYDEALKSDLSFTDDASIFQWYYKKSPVLIEGDRENIKITRPIDIELVSKLLF